MSSRQIRRLKQPDLNSDHSIESGNQTEKLEENKNISLFGNLTVETGEEDIEEPTSSIISGLTNSKKKKKRRKKKARKEVVTQNRDEQSCCTTPETSSVASNSAQPGDDESFLKVNIRNFDYSEEDARLTGMIVKKNRRKSKIRKAGLVPYRQSWDPLSVKGVEMTSHMENQNKIIKYKHLGSYKGISKVFYYYMENHNEIELMNMMQSNPFHLETIYYFGFLLRIKQENFYIYSELIERAIFILESCRLQGISFDDRSVRIPYSHYENRIFHLTIFNHILNLEEKCCYTACFEFCKLLINVDPYDSLGVLTMVDFYALKSKNYSFLVQLYNKQPNVQFIGMPNIRFSLALAHYFLNESDKFHETLQGAIFDFPYMLHYMSEFCMQKLPKEMTEHVLFSKCETKCSPIMRTLVNLYIKRMRFFFKNYEINKLFIDEALVCLTIYNEKNGQVGQNDIKIHTKYPKPLLRHIFLTNYSDEHVNDLMNNNREAIIADPFPPSNGPNPYIDLTTAPKVKVLPTFPIL